MNLKTSRSHKQHLESRSVSSPHTLRDTFLQQNQDWSEQIISEDFIMKQKHSSSVNENILNTIPSKKHNIEQFGQSISEKQELESKELGNNESWKNTINSLYSKKLKP